MSSVPQLSFRSIIKYQRVKWKQRGGRGRREEGFQKVFDRDSLFRRFIALISTPSNRTAIDREDNFREYPRTEKKKEEDEGERRKEKFERTSIERSVFDVDEICFSRQHRALCQRERVRRCSLMQRDCPDIYICTPKISSLVRVRIIVFSSRLKSDLLRNS